MFKKCLLTIVPSFLVCLAATTYSLNASATTELDHKYALETVGFLRSWDNVDGLFADYVAAAYKDYFTNQSRFVLQDLSKSNAAIARSNLPYNKIIQDPEILGQLARSTRTQSVIRTKVQKEGPRYRFTIEWLHAPKMDLMASEDFILNEPRDGKSLSADDIKVALQQALEKAISKVPFVATVTGRDNESVTVNIGTNTNLKKGDTLTIGTLDEVKKHPLLREIVSWRLTQTGKIEVEEIDEKIAFCKVIEEEPGRQIARYQKVIQILPRTKPEELPIVHESEERKEDLPPTLGWVSAGVGVGLFSRQYNSTNSTSSKTGSGLYLGPKADTQLWLNREWFVDLGLTHGFWSYSQRDTAGGAATAAGSVSSSLTSFRGDLGYSYLVTGSFFGPKGWVKLGYQSTSYSFPDSTSEFTAPISFGAFFLGLGGDLPIRSGWSATVNLDFGLLSSGSETGSSTTTVSSASHVNFFLGVSYRYAPRIIFRGGIDVLANGADYANSSSLSQKVITFTPSLLYYF